MSPYQENDCTLGCRSHQHGAQITAAIIRGTEAQAISYMKNLCQRCHLVTDTTGKTALHTAASCGKKKIVKWLVSQGVSLNQRDRESGYTPLHRALFHGHLGVACTLIQDGASISTLDHDALTPLDHINLDRPSNILFTTSLPTQVYVWGNNTNFNLGQTSQHARRIPECLESLYREGHMVTNVTLSKFHTLFLTSSGRVYTCGHGQGGRLGIDTDAPVITPRPIKVFTHTNVIQVASGTDHSLFLTDSGQVWSCGSNFYHQLGLSPPPEHVYTPRILAWHKNHRDITITGIGAAKYHSVIWTPTKLYTFGLNAGQLGHFKNAKERTITTPRNVASIVLKENETLACVGVSDGAIVLSTSHGDIYVLHQYQIRSVASKIIGGVVKVACIGGYLDSKVGADGLIEHGGDDLKIAVLIGGGARHLYLWTEQSSHLSRCTFSISREISVGDFCLSRHCLGIVTTKGEAFSGVILPTRVRKTTDKFSVRKSLWTSGQWTELFSHSACITVRLTRIPALHRTISIMCDPKGLNFAALQNEPSSFLVKTPHISPSSLKENFKTLLENADEMDTIHDVVIDCGGRRFPVHSYILASHSKYFQRIILKDAMSDNGQSVQKTWNLNMGTEKKCLILSDAHPEALEDVLTFIYTGSCKGILPRGVRVNTSFENDLVDINTNTLEMNVCVPNKNLNPKPEKQKKKKKQKFSGNKAGHANPLCSTLSLAKILEIPALEKALANLHNMDEPEEYVDQEHIRSWKVSSYSRENFPELWDVTLISKSGDKLGAHKCILAARLEYFNIMFGSRWIETTASESLNMPLPTSILSIILDYLYEDDAPKLRQCRDPEFVCNVLVVADQFLITRLREICEEIISGLLTLKNAGELLEFAVQYNATGLKTVAMQFICLNLAALLENGTLLSSVSSEVLKDLSKHYKNFTSCMSCRIITPYDVPPYAHDLEQVLEENPLILPESDEEWEDSSVAKGPGGGCGSARKKKRVHRNSLGDGRSRKTSTSSSLCSSDGDQQRELEEEFETLNFDDLQDRKQPHESPSAETGTEKENANVGQTNNLFNIKKGNDNTQSTSGNTSWQKVTRKKSTSDQSISAPANSPVDSPVKDNSSPVIYQSLGSLQDCVQNTETDEKFPSIQDSKYAAQRTSHKGKSSKIAKLSQKERKKLVAKAMAGETTSTSPGKEKTSVQSCPWSIPSLASGVSKDADKVNKNTSKSQSLADIMKAERSKAARENHVPVTLQDKENPARISVQISQKMTDKDSVAWSSVASSPPTSPAISSQLASSHCHPENRTIGTGVATPSFTCILLEEETRSDNLMREQSKPLSMIQLEDRAIEELLTFYGASECYEEKITVSRVKATLANPTWSK